MTVDDGAGRPTVTLPGAGTSEGEADGDAPRVVRRPVRTEPAPVARRDVATIVLAIACGVMLLAVLSTAVSATAVGLADGARVNGDEAVAAMLPLEFARGAPALLFPGNPYQGILETPVYAVAWQVFGPSLTPLRLFHLVLWIAGVGVWAWLGMDLVRRRTGLPVRSRWWGAFAVVGLLLVTSAAGWPSFFRIYPGYQLGALLAGLALVTASRARTWIGWGGAGVLAGLAIYGQPMHLGVVVAVGVAALVGRGLGAEADADADTPTLGRPGRSLGLGGRLLAVAVGGVVGASPLLLWNVRNDLDTFRLGEQPVQHPEWGYGDRLYNTFRQTGRILWGDDPTRFPGWAVPLRALVAVVLVGLVAFGAVRLARAGRAAWPLLTAIVVALLALPVLQTFSLETDSRYANAWWAALGALVAVGAASVAALRPTGLRRALLAVLVLAVASQVAMSVHSGVDALDRRTSAPSAESLTADLAHDLRRCGVDVVVGDYWGVYPSVWGSDGELRGEVLYGPDRMESIHPDSYPRARRLAVIAPAGVTIDESERTATTDTGRGAGGWVSVTHPPTGTVLALERTATPLPAGCIGPSGFRATTP